MPEAAVIFDLDGVLIDSEELQFRAYAEVLAALGVRIEKGEYAREWIAQGGGPEYAVRTYGLDVDPQDLRQRKQPIYHRLLESEARLMPGVEAALERLGATFPLGLATNSSRADLEVVLARFDIARFFQARITRECYQRAKPAPDAFRAAAAELLVEAGRCLVVEDTYRGLLAAHRAGCRCVVIPHELTRDNDFGLAAAVLGNLEELTEALVHRLVGPL